MKKITIIVCDADGIEIDRETYEASTVSGRLILAGEHIKHFVVPRLAVGQVISIVEEE